MSKGNFVKAALVLVAVATLAFATGAGLALRGTLSDLLGTRVALPNQSTAGQQKPKPDKERARRPGEPAPYYGDLRSLAAVNVRDAALDPVAEGLQYPWAMELLSPTEALVSEHGGTLQRVNLRDGSKTAISGLPAVPSGKGQVGLMDIALHPQFGSNHLVYFTHAMESPNKPAHYATALSRAQLVDDELLNVELLLVAEPYTRAAANFGGAIAFDSAGYLYVSIGDRTINTRAQDPRLLHGKILRLTADGSTPADNPFIGSSEVDPRIYAMGVRNAQGLVFDTISELLFEAEHGPMGGDEVNIIEAGRNYGWPTITYGANYTTENIGLGTHLAGMEQPLYFYLPSIAASPITIYRGTMFPEWEGHLLVGALKGAHVSKLALVDGQVRSARAILSEAKGRIRDLKVASDGSLYLLVQNGGRIMRLHRNPNGNDAEASKEREGVTLYTQLCSTCHSSGQPDVPQIDRPQDWETALAQDIGVLYKNTLLGIGDMPAKGLCENCTDDEIRAAVDFMVAKVAKARNSSSIAP
ncbi:MAG: PQQ-dependent sugar dehydrogenase [Haliea sp.]|nr:PQQ-dependent sugar dehydrogenase [Haliea sp.]MDP4917177.1 PQQ-dependent sugar dehydrogenase [Haliea sp.]MDP5063034.1 PQQ-dependent sugar dehydrogenase [Haliea sp.]